MNPATWADWLIATPEADEATALAALRGYIVQTARENVSVGDFGAAWANKKLASLGITEQVGTHNAYTIEVPASGTVRWTAIGTDRADAMAKMLRDLPTARTLAVYNPVVQGDPVIVVGPEDTVPAVIAADAPQTVAETLDALREIILLGVVAGPKFCEAGADRVLGDFDLPPVPARQQYVVTRPATAVLRTVVDAYDEVSAARVAGWRWDDGRKAYEVAEATATGDAAVDIN